MRFNPFIFLLLIAFISSSFQKKIGLNLNNEIWFKSISPESHLKWKASHLGGVAPRNGKIFIKSAKILIVENEIQHLSCTIDMNSILVENFKEKENQKALSLAQHLKSSSFFDTENYPISKFKMTKIELGSEEYPAKITGDLTILNSTKSITFFCSTQSDKNFIEIHSNSFKIDRTQWKLNYLKEGSKGISPDNIISNFIEFEISLKMKR